MTNEFSYRVLAVLCIVLLSSCGQTGALVLPGPQPATTAPPPASDADVNPEEDETDQ